jgi:hypothetical protein
MQHLYCHTSKMGKISYKYPDLIAIVKSKLLMGRSCGQIKSRNIYKDMSISQVSDRVLSRGTLLARHNTLLLVCLNSKGGEIK